MKVIKSLRVVHVLMVLGIYGVLIGAFSVQLFLNELPCPLCFLQRVGMLLMMTGLLMNIRFGFKPSHYGLVLLAAIFTAAVSLRQISLHVIPGFGGYGEPLFGFHLYTWVFISSVVFTIVTVLMTCIDRQYQVKAAPPVFWEGVGKILLIIAMFLALANMANFYLQCGWIECPDSPTQYILLK